MQLRWLEREIRLEELEGRLFPIPRARELQYLDTAPNSYGKDTWVSVPIVREEPNTYAILNEHMIDRQIGE